MKKRLLTVLLVAFVLCTMAINTFAIENQDGLPSILDHSLCYKAYGQYNWNTENYSSRVYSSGVCPDCGQNVTFIDWEIPQEHINTIENYTNNYLVIGSYYAFDYGGFVLDSYRLANISISSCEVYITGESDWYTQYDWRYLYNVLYDWNSNRLYIHSDNVPLDLVKYGYYVAIFNESDNYISSQVASSYNTLSSYLRNSSITLDLYKNRVMDWCLKNFISSPYQDILIEPYEESAFNNGYNNGYDFGYDVGEADGITQGELSGYETGYEYGYDYGYDDGVSDGFTQGELSGYETGYEYGYDYGYQDGLGDSDQVYQDGYDDGVSDGFTQGELSGYESGYEYGYDYGFDDGFQDALTNNSSEIYQNGFQEGTLHGQGQVDWSFVELLDGVFLGASHFIEPFLNIGIGDITIASVISLVGVVYVVMLILRIIRG